MALVCRRALAGAVFASVAGLASAVAVPESAYSGLRWRLLGPFRGGWSTVVTGVPNQASVFYSGAADGGVWKTTDAGRTWFPIFEREGTASVGALAIAPTNPMVIYVGTGQVSTRYDVVAGDGVYRSADGGRSWASRGLRGARHIGRIVVDPRDPDVALVAAMGSMFAAGDERGVFRTTDGGASWTRVLFVDRDTGAVDLTVDPGGLDVVYAATWQARHRPWQAYYEPGRGPGSAIHKSTDGGRTWTRLEGHGLPSGPLGRIGLGAAVTTPHGRRVYATIDAAQGAGLYRTDDAGETWQQVNADPSLASSYFSRLTVDPRDQDVVYVMGRSLRRSTDGGRAFGVVKGSPGGDDYHFMWIAPGDTKRMVLASDQGSIVSVNGGSSWSSWYNQPTGQFYHLGADRRFAYRVYSSQQDSGTAGVATRSDYGQLTFRDWAPVGGDERDFALPHPADPEIVFSSGLGGRLSRYDARTGRVANVSPWPVNSYARRPESVRYRYPWITALAISPLPPHAIYQGAQVLFRSLDEGRTWQVISPDLTGAQPNAPGCAPDVPLERATPCGYGTIFTIAPSPLERDLVWVGTDNGRIHLTRDGGAAWSDVTPPALADWSKVASLEASPHEAGTAFAAIDRHRLDDFAPRILVTRDFGRTWSELGAGLPADAYVNVVRQDPLEPRLLLAGTRTGVAVSFDGGERWQSLKLDLPTSGVNDLLVQGNDIVAATQGRALWVLDDLHPLRHLARGLPSAAAHLFPPAKAWRIGGNENRDTPLPREEPSAPNPPAGVALDYLLNEAPSGPLRLEIRDASGRVVRRFSSDDPVPELRAERYFEEAWLPTPRALVAAPGGHRFHWDLRGERPRAFEYEYAIAATPHAGTALLPRGPLVAPGRYEVRLSVGAATLTQPLIVEADPRRPVPPEDVAAQLELYGQAEASLSSVTEAQAEQAALLERLRAAASVPESARTRAVREQARRLEADLSRGAPHAEPLDEVAAVLRDLLIDLEGADGPPSEPQREVAREYGRRAEAALARWRAWRAARVPAFERAFQRAGLPRPALKP